MAVKKGHMYVGRTVAAVNPYSRGPTGGGKSLAVGNPAWLLTLGPVNPKARKGNTVAKKHKKASGHHSVSDRKSGQISMSKNSLMGLFKAKKRKKGRTRSSGNPFAKSISLSRPMDIATAGAGILVGVGVAKALAPMLPDAITSNNLYLTIAKFAIAGLEWWAFSMINPEFGAAAGLGGIAEAGSNALNTWFPSVGQYSPLGDFVAVRPGGFSVPQNPVDTSMPFSASRRSFAYGGAYRVAAA